MYDKKLDDYFLGELSDAEKHVLFDEIESNENHKSEFIRMQNTVSLSGLFPQKGDEEWSSRMKKELDRNIKRKYLYRKLLNVTKYAAAISFLILNIWLLALRDTNLEEEKNTYTIIEVPKGQRVSLTLEDGTAVWLSPQSVLRIPGKFGKEQRQVELNGEGYFSVVKDVQRPFIVQTGKHQVKVLGTRFNVFAYSKSSRFETDLLEGSVEVFNREYPEDTILLQPGERTYAENDRLIKAVSLFENEEYLKNGIFSFQNKPFGEILEYLALWYDVDFEVKEAVDKKHPISGKFKQNDDVTSLLKAIQDVHPFKYKNINEGSIEIY